MYNYYYPYTVGQSQSPVQWARKNPGWLVSGILLSGIMSYLLFRLARKLGDNSKDIVIVFKPPTASQIEIKQKDIQLAIAEECQIKGGRSKPVTTAVANAVFQTGVKGLKKDYNFRVEWTKKGFVPERPFYDARYKDGLNPNDPRWQKAVDWWAMHWYGLSTKERKSKEKPKQSPIAKETPDQTHNPFKEGHPSRGLPPRTRITEAQVRTDL